MATLHKDFLKGTTTVALNDSATGITSAGFTSLPTVNSPDVLYLTLDPEGVAGAPEVVAVTSHTGGANAVSVNRGQLGSVARSHAQGVVWVHGVYASELDQLRTDVDAKLARTGGTMTGKVLLDGDPTMPLHPATKQYTDAADALLAPKASPTFTGTVTVPTPVAAGAAATKGYVDGIQNFRHRFATATVNQGGSLTHGATNKCLLNKGYDPDNMVNTTSNHVVLPDAGVYAITGRIGYLQSVLGVNRTYQLVVRIGLNGADPNGDGWGTGRVATASYLYSGIINTDSYSVECQYLDQFAAGTTVSMWSQFYDTFGTGGRLAVAGAYLAVLRVA